MNKEIHPLVVLLLIALLTVEAVLVITVALIDLARLIARSPNRVMPTAPTMPTAAPVPVLPHPLAMVAAELEALPVTRLRPMAGVRSKRARKAELVAMLVAC